jgi:hypothetical protein
MLGVLSAVQFLLSEDDDGVLADGGIGGVGIV